MTATPRPTGMRPPVVSRLPEGFAEWAIAQASTHEGLLRADLTKRSGQEAKWGGYLRQVAGEGLRTTIGRDGRDARYIRYWMARKTA
jgi:hypothetical protein